MEPARGSVLRSRYELGEVIGRGGTSIIFRARDLHRSSNSQNAAEFVAIKLLRTELRADPLAVARLKHEYRQLQCLAHPGIVRVFDFDCDGDIWFMSMEFVPGRTVKAWIETPGSQADALGIISGCCVALEYAHSLGILHGDLKPTNAIVADDGRVKLIDFGSAASFASRVEPVLDPTLAFTPLYASPEVLAGRTAERRDDVFSLACLSYSIVSGGRHPFGRRPSLEDGRVKSAPTHVRTIPAELFTVIERGLSGRREYRQRSVAEFLRELTDANRRLSDMATGRPAPAHNHIDAVRHSASTLHGPDRVSRPRGPITTNVDGLGAAPPIARRTQNLVRALALVASIAAVAVLFRLDMHGGTIRTTELSPQTPAMPPAPVGTAQADIRTSPEARPSPRDSGVISFESSTVHASAEQPLVAISVKRLRATKNSGAFLWRVERGTAYPGVDYELLSPNIVRFVEGQTVRTLFIPMISTGAASLSRGPRVFTVALQQVAGGPTLGRIDRVTVTIDPPPVSSHVAAYQARVEP